MLLVAAVLYNILYLSSGENKHPYLQNFNFKTEYLLSEKNYCSTQNVK